MLTQRKDRVRVLVLVVGITALALLAAGLGRLPLGAGAQLPAATFDSPTGMYSNGALLMNGRLVTPAGAVSPVGNFPENVVVSPDGTFAVVTNNGQGEGHGVDQGNESLQVVNLSTGLVVQTITDHAQNASTFYNFGLVFSRDGKHLYAAGGGNDGVYDYAVTGMSLKLASTWISTLEHGTPPVKIPGGLTPGIPTTAPMVGNVAGYTRGIALTPDGGTVVVANEEGDNVAALSTAGGTILWETPLGGVLLADTYPGAVALSPDGKLAYVTQQGLNTVTTLDVATGAVRGLTPVGDHPTHIVVTRDGRYAFVTNANDDSVSILDLTGPLPMQTRQLSTHLFTGEANGSTPNTVALDEDRGLVYVANAGDNAVAVLGASVAAPATGSSATPLPGPVQSPLTTLPNTATGIDISGIRLLGFIPSAFYPTGVAVRPSDGQLLTVSAKGYGGVPVIRNTQYDGNDMVGLLNRVNTPTAADLTNGWNTALYNLRFGSGVNARRQAGNPIPDAAHAGTSPIKHVVLIVRENRTFDQVFGDLPSLGVHADSDPANLVFPRTDSHGKTITPNAHKIITQFGGSDNFYSDGDASIQGHHWTAEGASSDYTEKSWMHYYSNRNHTYDPVFPIVYPRCGSIFQYLAMHGKTFKDYGELVGASTSQPPTVTTSPDGSCPVAGGTYDGVVASSGLDAGYPNNLALTSVKDTDRLTYFKTAYQPLVDADQVPQLTYLLMGNDHTDGTSVGKPTPQAHVAINDQAVGGVVDYLSHTPQWSSTQVFVEEDDSQDGLDHRDGHRNIFLAAGPYVRPGTISHVHTSQASVMRMIELILGVPPISSYSQTAPVPYDLFQTTPTTTPYTVDVPTYDMTSTNQAGAAGVSGLVIDSRIDMAGPLLEAQIWAATRPGQPLPWSLARRLAREGITAGS